jgi:hypothetical protein
VIQPVEIEAAEVYSFELTSRQNYNAGEIQMREQLRRTFLAVSLLLTSVSASFGEPLLSITPASGNSFTVQGNNMDGVAGIELNLTYDNKSLDTPTVVKESLVSTAMLAANTAIPGSIRIAIISTTPFSGSGPVATIKFANGSGSVRIVSQNTINSSGAQIGSGTISDLGPGVPFSQPVTTTTTPTTATGTSTGNTVPVTSIPTYQGTVAMPLDTAAQQPIKQPAPVEQPHTQVASAPSGEASPPPDTPRSSIPAEAKTEPARQITHIGILERFRIYEGEKTPAALSALFTREVTSTITQTPAIAVSDGTGKVTVTVELPVSDVSPNFAINGAKMASIGKDNDTGRWIIELLPHKSVFRATLTIMTGNTVIDYPLTVILPVGAMKFTDKDFSEFIKDSGAAKPKFDLNGDGRHDYIDNYIYTGHYLLNNEAGKKPQLKGAK